MTEFSCEYLDTGVVVISNGDERVEFPWQIYQDMRQTHYGVDIEAEITRMVCQELGIVTDEDKLALIAVLLPIFNNTLENQTNG